MKKAILLSVLLSGCGLFKNLPSPQPQKVEEPKVDLIALAVDNTLGIIYNGVIECTGTAVEGTFLTALHCIQDEGEFQISYRGKTYKGILVSIFEEADLAVVDAIGAPTKNTLEMSPWEPIRGMKVVWLGYPLDYNLQLFAGHVSSVEGPKSTQFDIAGPVIPGTSGGPVLDEKGRLIGIISAFMAINGIPHPQVLPVGHIILPQYIRTMLELDPGTP